ncbi:hypothetical protein CTAYLR_003989 [Chrysophaeum taylorii]|uniref:Methyltransferase domain-containing protein n=1 Tax=Chrysophaeum taylorii TaxID=2483200 RepID=A0AAD7U7M3_9STRA|nr:hypothetical protein CTAYLR_003989 [Chrysophaeum taylorii]
MRVVGGLAVMTRLHEGSRTLPPMVQLDGRGFGLEGGIVSSSAEELWDWAWATGYAERYDPDPSCGTLWAAAQHLALSLREEDVRGKNVVELGAGLGVPGIVAKRLGAADVNLIDREPLALHMAMATAELNGVSVRATKADFTDVTQQEGVDLVLAADVLYDEKKCVEALATTIESLVLGKNNNGGRALVADPAGGRAHGARDAFCEAARRRGARIAETPFDHKSGLEPTVLLDLRWN